MIALPLALLLSFALQPAPSTTPAAETPTPTPAASAVPEPAPSSVPPSSMASEPAAESPAPAESSAPSVSPAPATSPAPASPAAAPAPSITAAPQIVYGYRFVPRQPDHVAAGQPQIFAIYLNSNKLKSLGPIDIKVATTPDVVKVFTHSNGRDSPIPMLGPGDFEAIGKLPKLPFIASGVSTTIEFVAVGASGKRVTIPVPVLLQ